MCELKFTKDRRRSCFWVGSGVLFSSFFDSGPRELVLPFRPNRPASDPPKYEPGTNGGKEIYPSVSGSL